MNVDDPLLGLHAQLACLWEATARKPGNVHRFRDFEDTTYLDFAVSAAAIAGVIARAPHTRVGATTRECVRLTRLVTPRNTNLGIVLLLAPLARASARPDLRACVADVLADLDADDASLAYQAIRLANPGGLGSARDQDVRDEPRISLRQAMTLAADRDLVARQYANGFAEVFDDGAPAVLEGIERTGSIEGGIVHAHLHLLSRHPDSLIARKRGIEEASEASSRARRVLDLGWPHRPEGRQALDDLDTWLRAEGNSRNPGTTADLIAACLFVLLRRGDMRPDHLGIPWPLDQ